MPEEKTLSRQLAEKARELMLAMRQRVKRDPDIADFDAAFSKILSDKGKS